jgi:NAD/NADP transhydrogenase alpha subunit
VRIGVPRESRPGETRVAATPKTVEQIVALGYAVFVESGAGAASSFADAAYARAGADVIDEAVWNADVLLKINAPSDAEIARLRPGQVVVSLLAPALNPELVDKLAARGVTALAMDAVPRISRAQSLDVLSSMANIGGYRAVVEAALYADQAADVDIVITTALIPGRPAPRLLTEAMVASMKAGSVIVDMAASNGGNVAGSVADQKVVTEGGVTILGYTDLPGRLPTQASQLFGTNLVNLLKLVTPNKDGQFSLDLDDPVQRGMTAVCAGEVLWPPPPVQVSAAPVKVAAPLEPAAPKKKMSQERRLGLLAAGSAAFLLLSSVMPEPFLGHFMVFMLSVVIGFYVIGNVHHALHTPLMSVTNAISGIILVGALLQVGHDGEPLISVLAFIAILVASINVFGGFTVTARMLQMFKREDTAR